MEVIYLPELDVNVSEDGVVTGYRKKLFREYKHQTCRAGYKRVHITTSGKRKCCGVHRLVAMAFIPNPHNKPDVNHIDGIKANNHVSNLEWVTEKENTQHAMKNLEKKPGRPPIMTERDKEIVGLFNEGKTRKQIAEIYGTTRVRITQIIIKELKRCA